MTSDDQLRSVFHAHAGDAPDATVVHAEILATLTRKRRQRHAAHAAGAALVIGGLVAVPIVANSRTNHTQRVGPALGSSTLPTATLPPSSPSTTTPLPQPNEARSDLDVVAFFDAGYTYDDAVELAKIWNVPDPYLTKQLAGQQLSDGKQLPIAPGHSIAVSPGAQSRTGQELTAFSAQGYGVADATQLAAMWHEDGDLTLVKMLAGQQLLDGIHIDVP